MLQVLSSDLFKVWQQLIHKGAAIWGSAHIGILQVMQGKPMLQQAADTEQLSGVDNLDVYECNCLNDNITVPAQAERKQLRGHMPSVH